MLIVILHAPLFIFFFFNDTATTEIYTLSLHDALPISSPGNTNCRSGRSSTSRGVPIPPTPGSPGTPITESASTRANRSEEHTSELQSLRHLVCRLLLEKKKTDSNPRRCTTIA